MGVGGGGGYPTATIWWAKWVPIYINPIPPRLFWSSLGLGGGGGSKAPSPLYKSENVDAIVMKHYGLPFENPT